MIDPETEARLLALLRGKRREREDGLRELFETTRSALYGIALRMTGRPDLADDAVQETCVDVMRGIPSFRGESRLTSWLFRVAVRASVRVGSRARRREEVVSEELVGELAGGEDPSVASAQRDSAARILNAIASLPAPRRAVIALSALEGLPQTEVALVLGIPDGTVYSRLHEARKALKARLDAKG